MQKNSYGGDGDVVLFAEIDQLELRPNDLKCKTTVQMKPRETSGALPRRAPHHEFLRLAYVQLDLQIVRLD